MKKTPILFSPDTPPRKRRVYGAVTIYFIVVFVAMMWPVYPAFSRIRPLVLGMPLSLAYLVALLILSFLVALGLYLWESRTGRLE